MCVCVYVCVYSNTHQHTIDGEVVTAVSSFTVAIKDVPHSDITIVTGSEHCTCG